MKLFNNIKNFKKNYEQVKSSPYKSLLLRLKMNKYMFIFMLMIVIWRVIDLIINFTTITLAVNKIFLIVLGLWLLYSFNNNKKKIINHIEAYKGRPETQGYYDTSVNVKTEIDDLINKLKEKEVKNDRIPKTTKK